MTQPTREQIEEFVRNNKLDVDESYPRSDWWKFKQQRDEYKRQRDELIEDMAEIKRKAQAFDEIALTVLSEDNDVIKNMNNRVTKIVINNLERGE
ncbi:hypothetical protein BUZ67_04030 [Staphylococcus pasteuri]|nr:hypothetical protein [Staphylococcus pasteuri]PTU82093.1 hypothetical protein BUZ66_07545 [Staphylococcus pasteuri]PTU85848.1 hypothetical protein BUZ67_04030 [Staphylococcus pasteuri]RIO36495.1 hypothetical protein BUZ65_05585 [Staphylococcus pasteuri]RIO41979.1 hypothetical protein BUZ63_00275 [Staphylococcus pasteuri]